MLAREICIVWGGENFKYCSEGDIGSMAFSSEIIPLPHPAVGEEYELSGHGGV